MAQERTHLPLQPIHISPHPAGESPSSPSVSSSILPSGVFTSVSCAGSPVCVSVPSVDTVSRMVPLAIVSTADRPLIDQREEKEKESQPNTAGQTRGKTLTITSTTQHRLQPPVADAIGSPATASASALAPALADSIPPSTSTSHVPILSGSVKVSRPRPSSAASDDVADGSLPPPKKRRAAHTPHDTHTNTIPAVNQPEVTPTHTPDAAYSSTASYAASLAQPSPSASDRMTDVIVVDDDDDVLPIAPSGVASGGGRFGLFRGLSLPVEDPSVVDLTADESFDALEVKPNTQWHTPATTIINTPNSETTLKLDHTLPSYVAARQSIPASLFSSKGSLLPSSSYNPYSPPATATHTITPIASPSPSAPAGLSSVTQPAMKVEFPSAQPSNTVDLLPDSDDDALSDNKYGTLLCMVHGVRICPGKAQPKEIVTLTRIKTGADTNAIRVDNIAHQPCGVLSKDVAAALAPLLDKKLVRVDAKVGSASQTELGLRIDLYGRSNDQRQVERHLRAFPMVQYLSLADAMIKVNPMPHAGIQQFLQQHGAAAAAAAMAAGQSTYINEFGEQVGGVAAESQGLSVREIENDLDSLFGHEIDLATMPLAAPPPALRTGLHPYQRQGLAWMLQHEHHRALNVEGQPGLLMGWAKQVDSRGQVTFVNKITKEVQTEPPAMQTGGILADEMGLGKSLTTLALIASTLHPNAVSAGSAVAGAGAGAGAGVSPPIRPTHTPHTLSLKSKGIHLKRVAPTLIVCPLSVITNWEQQILHHFHPNQRPTYYTYHGPNRLRDVTQLRQYDIIITTYNILSQEYDISCAALGLDDDSSDSADDELPFGAVKKKSTKKRKDNHKIDAAQAAAAAAAAAALHASGEPESSAPRRAPLFDIDFFRIVLDEAHVIRESRTCQSRAARALRGERRWAISGTPLVNKVDDAFALLNFIKVPPFTSYAMWQKIVLKPLKNRDPKGMQRLQQIMSTICLRRRKNEEINGKRILILPEKVQRTRQLILSGKEKALYDTLAESGRTQFNRLVRDGSVLSHYAYVLEILLRMRQACNHSMLVPDHYHSRGFLDLASGDRRAEMIRLVNLLEDSLADECGICHKTVDDPVITQCAHFYCRGCLDAYTQNAAYHNAIYMQQFHQPGVAQPQPNSTLYCQQCRLVLDKSLIVSMHHKELLRLEHEQQQAAALHAKGHVTLSPKLLALLEELQLVLNRNDKAVIFSQWTSFLNILQSTLDQASVKHVRLDGQMNAASRARALKSFEDDDSVKVFLISLKAGGTGLNLTAASSVFLMDPWWSPAIEDQAVDRVHRLGQSKNVDIVRFVCKDSVEEKIMELQDAKRQMTTAALTRASKSREAQQADRLQDLLTLFK